MGASPHAGNIGTLVFLLERRISREEARRALVATGEEAFEACVTALVDPDSPHDPAVRRHLPRTLALFDPQTAADVLLAQLGEERDGTVRYQILRALGLCRTRDASVKLDRQELDAAIDHTLERMFEAVDTRATMARHAGERGDWNTPVRELIDELLSDKQRMALERLFRLFSLRYPKEDFRRIHRGVESGSPSGLASARELLEDALPAARREAVLGLLDDVDPTRRLRAGERYYRPRREAPAELLKRLLEREDLELRCLVAYHVSEIGLTELREDLRELATRATDMLAESLERSVQRLDEPGRDHAFAVPLR
jgi:hypothetical protein